MRRGELALGDAIEVAELAEELLRDGEFLTPATQVLRLAVESGCSAYDCEFVALARAHGVALVTTNRAVLARFPDTAIPPADLAGPG